MSFSEDTGVSARYGAQAAVVRAMRDDHDWDAEKAAIFDQLGDLSGVKLLANRILVASWIRPDFKDLGDGKRFFLVAATQDNDKWMGKAGLIVKMGPQAWQDDETYRFCGERCEVGDWVTFRRGDTTRMEIRGVPCLLLEQETAIKAVLNRPDMVW